MILNRFFSFASLAAVLIAVGCNDEPKSGNGVNDVRAACDLKLAWNRTAPNCDICESAVIAPRCECESLKDFSAACIEQGDARKASCPETMDTCVFNCQRTDCNCIEQCYANDARCKQATAARDGCVVEACTQYCK